MEMGNLKMIILDLRTNNSTATPSGQNGLVEGLSGVDGRHRVISRTTHVQYTA
ncbi:unnamed protein product, partial [Nesidiocoris tenuis]